MMLLLFNFQRTIALQIFRDCSKQWIKWHSLFVILIIANPIICASQLILGIEGVTAQDLQKLAPQGKQTYTAGLVTNQTGITQNGERTIDRLRSLGVNLVYIFVPEHGIDGKIPAEKPVPDSVDPETKIPIISVYGSGTGKNFNTAKMAEIDVLFFDIQDCGMRHYTYISTMIAALKACQETHKQFAIFDRPNLLGGRVEGPVTQPDLISFISAAQIPLRYGLTIGELALYYNKYFLTPRANLQVFSLKQYNRDKPPYNLLAPLSPNLPTMAAVKCYCFGGLLGEVTPIDVGIGTGEPFQRMAVPEHIIGDAYWPRIRNYLNTLYIVAEDITYEHLRKKQRYRGFTVKVPDINLVEGFNVFLAFTNFVVIHAREVVAVSSAFDKAVGTSLVKTMMQAKATPDYLARAINNGLKRYGEDIQPICLYDPKPHIPLFKTESFSWVTQQPGVLSVYT